MNKRVTLHYKYEEHFVYSYLHSISYNAWKKKKKKSKKALHFNLIKDLQSQGMAANISMAMFAPLLILISLAVIHHVDSDEMVHFILFFYNSFCL